MEAALSQPKSTLHQLCTFTPKIGASRPHILSFPVQINQKKQVLKMMKCAKGDSAEKILVVENEEELDIDEDLKKLNEKCRGIGGIAELMECLEREAIMGEDQGREANDYNRRALIFHRSSTVFQALKRRSQTQPNTSAAASASATPPPCV